jgi:hypothetical protein
MGMSTHVVGFKPPDDKFKKMKAAWDACKLAGVNPPKEVLQYFNDCEPDPSGVEIDEATLTKAEAVKEWGNDHGAGFEIDVRKLPKDVVIVRVYNSW